MTVPFSRLFCCYRVTFSGVPAKDVYQFARDNKLNCWGYSAAEDGFSVFLTVGGAKRLVGQSHLADAVRERCLCGLFAFFWQHRARVGLAVGVLLSALMLLFLSGQVWDVRVEGNAQYSDAYLKETLAAQGLSVGTRISDFDRAGFCADYLIAREELSFLSVNFRGTVAYVQVIERQNPDGGSEKTGAANLVASSDAVIHSLSVKTGEPLVHVGAVVCAGEPLVSGVREGAGGSSLVYAEGEVIGRVRHTLTLKIPRYQEKKSADSPRLTGIRVNFFENLINIRLGASNSGTVYDTIYKNKSFYVTDAVRLPLSFTLVYESSFAGESVLLSDAETVGYATRCMNARLAVFLQDKELLSKRLTGAFDGDFYVITCEIECLENIAVVQEFSAN